MTFEQTIKPFSNLISLLFTPILHPNNPNNANNLNNDDLPNNFAIKNKNLIKKLDFITFLISSIKLNLAADSISAMVSSLFSYHQIALRLNDIDLEISVNNCLTAFFSNDYLKIDIDFAKKLALYFSELDEIISNNKDFNVKMVLETSLLKTVCGNDVIFGSVEIAILDLMFTVQKKDLICGCSYNDFVDDIFRYFVN